MATEEITIGLFGDVDVGKSWMIQKYLLGNQFDPKSVDPNDRGSKVITVKGQSVKLNLLASFGDEMLASMVEPHLTESDGVIFMYSYDLPESIDRLPQMFLEATNVFKSTEVPAILVANKCDLDYSERKIGKSAGLELAAKYEIPFMDTSVLEEYNLSEVFEKVVKIVRKWRAKNPDFRKNAD